MAKSSSASTKSAPTESVPGKKATPSVMPESGPRPTPSRPLPSTAVPAPVITGGGDEAKPMIEGQKVVSKPGAIIEVIEIELSEEMQRALTTGTPKLGKVK